MAGYASPLSSSEDRRLAHGMGIFYPNSSYTLRVGQEFSVVPTLTLCGRRRLTISPPLPRATVPALTLPTITPRTSPISPTHGPIAYKPSPEFSLSAGNATLTVYLPNGTAPASGWPVYLTNQLAAYTGLPVRANITAGDVFTDFLFRLINAGVAVIDQGIHSSGSGSSPSAWFWPPGTAQWANMNQRLPEKDVMHAIQWVTETGKNAPYNLDPLRIILNGASAGQIVGIFVAYHEDLAVPTAVSTQLHQRTDSVRALVSMLPVYDLMAYFDTLFLDINKHLESTTSPGNDCTNLANANQEARRKGTPSYSLHLPRSRGWEMPILMIGEEGTIHFKPAEWHTKTVFGQPRTRNYLGIAIHDAWNAGAWMTHLREVAPEIHRAKSRLWWATEVAHNFDTISAVEIDYIFEDNEGILEGISPDIRERHKDWVVARATEAFPHPHGLKFNPWLGTIWGAPDFVSPRTRYLIQADGTEFATSIDIEVLP